MPEAGYERSVQIAEANLGMKCNLLFRIGYDLALTLCRCTDIKKDTFIIDPLVLAVS